MLERYTARKPSQIYSAKEIRVMRQALLLCVLVSMYSFSAPACTTMGNSGNQSDGNHPTGSPRAINDADYGREIQIPEQLVGCYNCIVVYTVDDWRGRNSAIALEQIESKTGNHGEIGMSSQVSSDHALYWIQFKDSIRAYNSPEIEILREDFHLNCGPGVRNESGDIGFASNRIFLSPDMPLKDLDSIIQEANLQDLISRVESTGFIPYEIILKSNVGLGVYHVAQILNEYLMKRTHGHRVVTATCHTVIQKVKVH